MALRYLWRSRRPKQPATVIEAPRLSPVLPRHIHLHIALLQLPQHLLDSTRSGLGARRTLDPADVVVALVWRPSAIGIAWLSLIKGRSNVLRQWIDRTSHSTRPTMSHRSALRQTRPIGSWCPIRIPHQWRDLRTASLTNDAPGQGGIRTLLSINVILTANDELLNKEYTTAARQFFAADYTVHLTGKLLHWPQVVEVWRKRC